MHWSGLFEKCRHNSTGICHYLRFMFLKSKVQLSCSDLCLDHSCHQSKKWENSKEIQKFYFTDNLPASAKSAAMTLNIIGFPFYFYIFTICSGKCRYDSQDFCIYFLLVHFNNSKRKCRYDCMEFCVNFLLAHFNNIIRKNAAMTVRNLALTFHLYILTIE